MTTNTNKDENNQDAIQLKELGLNEPVDITEENKHRNDGKWCKMFREAQRPEVKQYAIGRGLNGISQQAVSKIESRKILPDRVLEVYAQFCHVRVDMIKNMPEIKEGETNTFNDHTAQFHDEAVQNITFNPIDKVVELCSEKDDLHREIIEVERAQKEELKKDWMRHMPITKLCSNY